MLFAKNCCEGASTECGENTVISWAAPYTSTLYTRTFVAILARRQCWCFVVPQYWEEAPYSSADDCGFSCTFLYMLPEYQATQSKCIPRYHRLELGVTSIKLGKNIFFFLFFINTNNPLLISSRRTIIMSIIRGLKNCRSWCRISMTCKSYYMIPTCLP